MTSLATNKDDEDETCTGQGSNPAAAAVVAVAVVVVCPTSYCLCCCCDCCDCCSSFSTRLHAVLNAWLVLSRASKCVSGSYVSCTRLYRKKRPQRSTRDTISFVIFIRASLPCATAYRG